MTHESVYTDGGVIRELITNDNPDIYVRSGNVGYLNHDVMQAIGYQPQPPEGFIISKNLPRGVDVTWRTMAEFTLYDIDQSGAYIATQDKVRWEYKVNRDESSSGAFYLNVSMRVVKLVHNGGLAPQVVVVVPEYSNGATINISPDPPYVATDISWCGMVGARFEADNRKIFGMGFHFLTWAMGTDGVWTDRNAGHSFIQYITDDKIGDQYINPVEREDPNEEPEEPDNGYSGPGGGNGTHDKTDDHVGIPPLPSISATAAGFVTLYNPSLQQIQAIADEMIQDSIWEVLKNFVTKFDEYVVGLGIIPVQPTVGASVYPRINLGMHYSTALPLVVSQFVEVNCGTVFIDNYYDSAFDYSGETSIQIFLPYVGYRDLNVDDIMGKTLGVVYHIDVYSGNLICYVTANGELYYQFSGNCLQQVPTATESYNSMLEGGVMFATAAVAAISTGGAAAGAAEQAATLGTKAAAKEAAQAEAAATAAEHAAIGSGMQTVMHEKPQITRSGSMGGSSGLLGGQIPYIIKTIPRQSLAKNFRGICGYPANISGTLGSFSGFTVVDSVNLQGIPGTDSEVAEILQYLKGGVIV